MRTRDCWVQRCLPKRRFFLPWQFGGLQYQFNKGTTSPTIIFGSYQGSCGFPASVLALYCGALLYLPTTGSAETRSVHFTEFCCSRFCIVTFQLHTVLIAGPFCYLLSFGHYYLFSGTTISHKVPPCPTGHCWYSPGYHSFHLDWWSWCSGAIMCQSSMAFRGGEHPSSLCFIFGHWALQPWCCASVFNTMISELVLLFSFHLPLHLHPPKHITNHSAVSYTQNGPSPSDITG